MDGLNYIIRLGRLVNRIFYPNCPTLGGSVLPLLLFYLSMGLVLALFKYIIGGFYFNPFIYFGNVINVLSM